VSEIFTPEQVAEKFQLSRGQVMRFVASGSWPCLRLSQKNVRFTAENIEQIENLYRVDPTTSAKTDFGRVAKGAL
jgi:predicted site-specific integrase-resolvase